MKTKLAINGFGRIGRTAFRIAAARSDVEIVAINDIADGAVLAYLLKYDTNYGMYDGPISYADGFLSVGQQRIRVCSEADPAALPWAELGVDVVIESSGNFLTTEAAGAHLHAGAKKVVVSAPPKDDMPVVMLGVNEDVLKTTPADVVSAGSCTTNSLGAAMAVLEHAYGIVNAILTTVHSYTASQLTQDGPKADWREGRAAAQNMIPTTTGAATTVAKVLPELAGKFDGLSVRVPTSVVSLSDVTAVLKRPTTVAELNETFEKAAREPYYQGILGVSREPLVSSDYIGNSHSGVVDLGLTKVVGGTLAKVMVWYDNEWGYCNRLVELVADVGKRLAVGEKQ